MTESIVIAGRFAGPPGSANGGYACGMVAAPLAGTAEVTLRSPPPLDVAIDLERTGDEVRASANGVLIAEARTVKLELEAPPAPSFAEAVLASSRYPWKETHPYPACFVCGPQRTAGDGLCIYPGAVEGRELAAAPFIPDASLGDESGQVRPEIMWAALDCPSWFGYRNFNAIESLVLLGRLAARVEQRPRVGQRCIAAGWLLAREGRKVHCGSAIYSEDGAVLGVGRATWIVLR